MNLTQAIDRYSAFQEARGDSPTHRAECRRILLVLVHEVGDLDLSAITPDQLGRFITGIRQRRGLNGHKQVSDLTVAAYHRVLAAYFRYLEDQELVPVSPMRKVPKPKVGEYLIRPFSDDQLKQLFAQPDTTTFIGLRDLTLMLFLLDSGARISELLGLKVADLDEGKRLARVLGKGKRERMVPFGELTQGWLSRYLERRQPNGPSDLVFVNQYGEPLTRNAVTQRIADYGESAGLRGVRVSAHTFRHTFGVRWLLGRDGYKGDAISLQRILGHTTPAMTQKYVHLVGDDLRQLHDRLSPADGTAPAPPTGRRKRIQ